MAADKKHWAESPAPGVALSAIILGLLFVTCGLHGHDVHPAQTFRTTNLQVDNVSSLGNVTTFANEAFAAPTGSVDNFDPWSGGTHTSRLEIDTTNAPNPFKVTGLVAGDDGDLLYIWNGGGSNDVPITFTDMDPASTPLNRFHLPSSGPYPIHFQGGALFIYLGSFGWSLLQGDGGNLMPTQLTLQPMRPAALANGSTNDNYNPWGVGGLITPAVFQDTGTASTITGFVAPNVNTTSFVVGNDGATLEFVNISSTGTITITCNDPGSLNENQIRCSASIPLTPFSAVGFIYDDAGTGGWRVKSLALSP